MLHYVKMYVKISHYFFFFAFNSIAVQMCFGCIMPLTDKMFMYFISLLFLCASVCSSLQQLSGLEVVCIVISWCGRILLQRCEQSSIEAVTLHFDILFNQLVGC